MQAPLHQLISIKKNHSLLLTNGEETKKVVTLPNQACEFDKQLVLTPKRLLHLLFQPLCLLKPQWEYETIIKEWTWGNVKGGVTSDGDERDEEVRRIGGDEVRESGGEDVGSVANGAAALVYELQLLALLRGDEIVENQPRVISLSLRHFLSYESKKRSSDKSSLPESEPEPETEKWDKYVGGDKDSEAYGRFAFCTIGKWRWFKY